MSIASVYEEKIVKANMQHKCGECWDVIAKGQKYYYITGLWEDKWHVFKFHKDCHDLRRIIEEKYNKEWDDYIPFGELSDAIADNFDQKFLRQWSDEDDHWELSEKMVTGIKLKLEFDLL